MQLSFFPSLLPDEPIYSLVARYHSELGYHSFKDTVTDLFGCRSLAANIELPSKLEVLSERLPWKHLNAGDFIWMHTAVPYYAFFISQELQLRLIQAVKRNSPPSAPAVIGAMTQKIQSAAFLKYCEECVTNDREQFGNAYWHRVHQLPGLKVCPSHNVVLSTTEVSSKSSRLRYEFITLETALIKKRGPLRVPALKNNLHLSFALDSRWLLEHAKEGPDLSSIQAALQSRMRLFDWLSHGGSLRASTLRRVWDEQYPLRFREEIGCGLEKVSDPIPLIRNLVIGGRSFVHPLIGIMIVHLLGLSAHKLSSLIDDQRYLSKVKPLNYYCVNPLCPDVNTGRWVVEKVSTHDVKRSVITCTKCGMVYTQDELLSRPPHIIERGHLWISQLKALIGAGCYSLREVSRQLGVDPATIKRFMAKDQILKTPNMHEKNEPIKTHNHPLKIFNRQQWKSLKDEHLGASRTELRKMKPALWVWLKRHDAGWLDANVPAKKRVFIGGKKMDRAEEDKQLCLALSEEAKTILNEESKLIKVTRTELARRLGKKDLFRKELIDGFPKTKKIAQELIETREQFAQRRVERCGEQFLQEGKIPERWELVRRAGLRPDMEAYCDKHIERVLVNLRKI
ncbi:MAG: TnsD family Tn7-like transposition protein [Cycloclasticus sp.]|nr:TnsD family Tn7-like transposition protein [Cycloclasticus sp.]